MIVIISFFSFWIKLELAEARITLGAMAFLTIITMTRSVNNQLPTVSYVKALGMVFCTKNCNLLQSAPFTTETLCCVKHNSNHYYRLCPRLPIKIIVFKIYTSKN